MQKLSIVGDIYFRTDETEKENVIQELQKKFATAGVMVDMTQTNIGLFDKAGKLVLLD